MAQYCPYTETCPFYQNWVEQTKDRRVDVIVTERKGENIHHDCLTLISLDDPETGIPMGEKLESRLSDPGSSHFLCSHITLLNLLGKAE